MVFGDKLSDELVEQPVRTCVKLVAIPEANVAPLEKIAAKRWVAIRVHHQFSDPFFGFIGSPLAKVLQRGPPTHLGCW
jgi:hypothetical protein